MKTSAIKTETVLLIMRSDTPDVKVNRVHLAKDRRIVTTLQSVLIGKLRRDLDGAQLIDEECAVWNVTSYRIGGLAGPKQVGVSVVGYLFLLVFGALTLIWPLKVQLELTPLHKWDISTVKKCVTDLIDRNPNAYVHEAGTRLRRLIWTCKSVRCIGAAIMGSPSPNVAQE